MTLLQDPVASVRAGSYKGVSKMITVLNGLPTVIDPALHAGTRTSGEYVDAVTSAINELVRGETYQQRQLWLELTRQLLCDLPKNLFERYLIHGILILTSDTVSSVRIGVADLLAGWAPDFGNPWDLTTAEDNQNPWKWLLDRSDIKECVRRLSRDDNDVYLKIKSLAPLFPHIEFTSISCRGLKEPPGGLQPIEMVSFFHVSSETEPVSNFDNKASVDRVENESLIVENDEGLQESASFPQETAVAVDNELSPKAEDCIDVTTATDLSTVEPENEFASELANIVIDDTDVH